MNKRIYDVEDPQPKTSWYDVAIKAVNIINNTIPSGCKTTKRELFYNAHNTPPFLAKFTIDDHQDNLDKDLQHRSKDYEENLIHSKKHDFKIHDLVIIRNHAPTPTGISSSFNLKMNTDIFIITEIKTGSRTITIKNIESDKTKEVNSEDIVIIPLENYFFKSKRPALNNKLEKEVVDKNKAEPDPDSKDLDKHTEDIFNQKITKDQDTDENKITKTQMTKTEAKADEHPAKEDGPIARRLRSRQRSL